MEFVIIKKLCKIFMKVIYKGFTLILVLIIRRMLYIRRVSCYWALVIVQGVCGGGVSFWSQHRQVVMG